MPNALPMPLSPPVEYVAGTPVRSTATWVNQNGVLTDATVAASIQYGPVAAPVIPAVVHDSTGVYHCVVPTVQWGGPGPQNVVVTWTATGALTGTLYDAFVIVPTGSSAADSVGP